MTPAERYLRLSNHYCDAALGGVRWSFQEDALVYKDGSTFAFNEEVALFLEGFASGGRMVHFVYVLHLLQLFKDDISRTGGAIGQRLTRAYKDAGSLPRNAGVFGAILCRDIPEVAAAADFGDVLARLRDKARPIRWHIVSFHSTFRPDELPPLDASEFVAAIRRKLEGIPDSELLYLLSHGCGSVQEAGKKLVRALPLPPPRGLAGVLATLLERPRLAGSRPFVMQLLSALALPPRERRQPAMPQGGYADVTTQGQPNRLLPSQFALDEWDFLRRFADRELLYFRREDPHVNTRHELIVILDQGVRTWGTVRLVLGAAVLALGRLAAQRRLPFYVAATSNGGTVVDPVGAEDDALGSLVEASDLSANPGLALERVLDRPAPGTCDIVLLTHPRNLLEEEVRAAALRARADTRILALALDDGGRAALSELRRGVPVPIRQFHVDCQGNIPIPPAPPQPSAGRWRGDVEPIGFPFRFGPGTPLGPDLFEFDLDGRWLLTATQDGMLHLWATNGSGETEILPRAMLDGCLLSKVEAMVGVAGGFVVSCRLQQELMVAHYDLRSRTCTGYLLGDVEVGHTWRYSPEHHVVVAQTPRHGSQYALDLGTGRCFPEDQSARAARARLAFESVPTAYARRHDRFRCGTVLEGTCDIDGETRCILDSKAGSLVLTGACPAYFVPLADGRPVLENCTLLAAEFAGDVLALRVAGPSPGNNVTLRLFRAGVPLAEYKEKRSDFGFKLSPDGKLLARQFTDYRVEVRATDDSSSTLATDHKAIFARPTHLFLGPTWFLVRVGKRGLDLVSWSTARLEYFTNHCKGEEPEEHSPDRAAMRFLRAKIPEATSSLSMTPATPSGVPLALHFDKARFLAGATLTVTAILDRFGQVVMLDANAHVVCVFLVVGRELSAWLPDGTCFGPASPTGKPPTEDDLEHVASALRQAASARRRD